MPGGRLGVGWVFLLEEIHRALCGEVDNRWAFSEKALGGIFCQKELRRAGEGGEASVEKRAQQGAEVKGLRAELGR